LRIIRVGLAFALSTIRTDRSVEEKRCGVADVVLSGLQMEDPGARTR
jgi:hypothetical protein